MLKKAQVIMLPTENILQSGNQAYHSYIISDDEIKEGDWYYDNIILQIRKWKSFMVYNQLQHKKIIATTDTSLLYNRKQLEENGLLHKDEQSFYKSIPQPSQQFIEKYIESYNKGEVITDVLVEYTHYDEFGNYISGDIVRNNDILKLKVNPKDNTITIKKIKDSYNREEVKLLIEKYQDTFGTAGSASTFVQDWIKNNL